MDFHLLIKAYIIGVTTSLPLGPLAILVIQRTANKDLKSGWFTGLGVTTIDSFWALVAGFSVTYIISFLRHYQMIIQGIGALILFGLGLYIFLSHPARSIRKYKRKGSSPLQCYFSTILVALANPLLVLVYIAVLASSNIVFDLQQPITPAIFLLGFALGAITWWTILSSLINRFRHHFNLRILWWFNKISGFAIMLFVVVSSIIVFAKGSPTI